MKNISQNSCFHFFNRPLAQKCNLTTRIFQGIAFWCELGLLIITIIIINLTAVFIALMLVGPSKWLIYGTNNSNRT